ncbi:GNAT family N-acetyltransferase [Nodosilinea sp. LEGE 07088]|uniref:GNAT family N-acetyltransferase n=1 Tax=Nodosilinea sp. LEGE 07088 TaxID=2777968 RepID=UPI0018800F6F|nr:N-acetyltransferase [Nodosilinea sp. LEGE 07088]MBE9139190.1 GNAT family N-acetyltransferase [Nodosilinea sp. LEGE 07088]
MIETATSEDFEAIADLNIVAYVEFASYLPPESWENMQKNLRNIKARAEVAEFMICHSGNDIIGSVAYCPAGKGDPEIFKPDTASILLLAVHPQHRGKGIAKALTMECIAKARNDKARLIGLFTSELMQSAQHLYRSLGFQQESELPKRYGIRYFRFILPLASNAFGS